MSVIIIWGFNPLKKISSPFTLHFSGTHIPQKWRNDCTKMMADFDGTINHLLVIKVLRIEYVTIN
jgi:hypothetical protein